MSSNDTWYVRLKVYNPQQRCVRKRWYCTHPKINRLFRGGDGVQEIPVWYAVDTEQAVILSQEKQFDDDPFSPALFDIVSSDQKAQIEQREAAARRMILGMADPAAAEQRAQQTMALAQQAAQQATAMFNPASGQAGPFGNPSGIATPPGLPKDQTVSQVEDLRPKSDQDRAAEEALKLKQFQNQVSGPMAPASLDPHAYLAQQQNKGLTGMLASNPQAAAELTDMVQKLATQMAHSMVVQMTQGPQVAQPQSTVPAPQTTDSVEESKAGRAVAMEGIEEAVQSLPDEPEEPTPSADEAAPVEVEVSPPAPRSKPSGQSSSLSASLDLHHPNNTAGAEDFELSDDDDELDPTMSYDGTPDKAYLAEKSREQREAAEDRQLAAKAIENASKSDLVEFAEKQGLQIDKRLGVGKLREAVRKQMLGD